MAAIRLLRRKFLAETGATATEYALMVGLIAVAVIVAVTLFGGSVAGLFDRSAASLPLNN